MPLYTEQSDLCPFLKSGFTIAIIHSFGISHFIQHIFMKCNSRSVGGIPPYLRSSILMLSISVAFLLFEAFNAHSDSSFVTGSIPPAS
jgi:hypothetical protein